MPTGHKIAGQPQPAITPGVLLAGLSLPLWPTGVMVDLRSGHGPRVLVQVHSATCLECRRYLSEELALAHDQLAEWGGRLAVVVPGEMGRASELAEAIPEAIQVLADPEGTIATGKAMVVITDEWAEIYSVTDVGPSHNFPAAGEIAEWVRFIAIQCPECQGQEGDWKEN